MTADADLARLRQLMAGDVSLERAWHAIHSHHFQGRAVASTAEALVLGLRERGSAALKEAPVRRRLGELNEAQLRGMATRLQKLKPAWTPGEIDRLLEIWAIYE